MPDKIRIHMFPAEQGDAFLISCGSGENKKNILIDGGTNNTFKNYLHDFLHAMHEHGERIDLLIVTHIDNDHIAGIIELFNNNGLSECPKVIKVENVWHNAYLQLQFDKQEEITEHQRKVLEYVIAMGDGRIEKGKSEISGRQGSKLGSFLYQGIYNWNRRYDTTDDDGKAIYAEALPTCYLSDDLKLHLLSPTRECLDELARYWLEELHDRNYVGKPSEGELFDDAFEMMLRRIEEQEKKRKKGKKILIASASEGWEDYKKEPFKEDNRKTNKSSFAFVLEFMGKRLLYLGDAHPSVVIERIKEIYKSEEPPYKFNAIKLSHHGSSGNMSPDLLNLIVSEKYLISTDGSYGHPDLSVLIKIVESTEGKKELIFNYEQESEKYMRLQREKQDLLNYKTEVKTYLEI